MATERFAPERGMDWRPNPPRGPSGRRLCRQCATEVPVGRRTFCSDQCVDDWKLRTDAGFVREKVLVRDRGICGLCGIDVLVDRQDLRVKITEYPHWVARKSGKLWQADHIVPVVEGGGLCGLEGYRTLCTACHRAETAALARRRALVRRDAGRGLLRCNTLTDRTGERCVACRKGVYGPLIVRELKGKKRAAWVDPNRVRCSDCGATVDRWREA